MNESKLNNLMHMFFMVIFTLLLFVIHGLLDMNSKNVDKIVEISNKINVPCEIKTNQVLYVTVHKIVK